MNHCPLGRTRAFKPGLLPIFDELEVKLKKTKAQLFLKWAVQNNFVTIPKSVNAKRIKENADLFGWTISDEDMTSIGQLQDNVDITVATRIMHVPWAELER